MLSFLEYPTVIKINDKETGFRTHFLYYIKACEVLEDEDILEKDKIELLYKILSTSPLSEFQEKLDFVMAYFQMFEEKKKAKSDKVFDIVEDREYIYGAFYQAYKIDLDSANLTTGQFLALLKSLPADTRFSEIIKIRTMKLPTGKGTEQQRTEILKAKQSVALKKNKNDISRQWAEFGAMIKAMSKTKGDKEK